MKSLYSILVVLVFFISLNALAQTKSKKELRELEKQRIIHVVDSIVNSHAFLFVADRATTMKGRNVDMVSRSNRLVVSDSLISGDLAYFGASQIGGYGVETGIKMNSKPTAFSVKKTKKKYAVSASIKEPQNGFKLYLSIDIEGYATLSVTSTHKDPITYYGSIQDLPLTR